MNMENTNMTTSEKLHLLLDGESEGIDTAEVLNEVSNSPELTQEFVDLENETNDEWSNRSSA